MTRAGPPIDAAPDRSGPVARLAVTRALPVGAVDLCRAFGDPRWLGGVIDDSAATERGLLRVETDLAFALTDDPRTLTFRKAAHVDLGVERAADGSCTGIVEWRAATLAPLFPVFAGTVVARGGTLRLDGAYAPPGGGVGLLVDRGFLHHFARRTAAWFLDRLVTELRGDPSDR